MIRVAFTGTRYGMTSSQRRSLEKIFLDKEFVALHGDCVGADEEFHTLVSMLDGCHHVELYPSWSDQRAFCSTSERDVVHKVDDPLVRDRQMVSQCDVLIVVPKEHHEVVRSGTWTTCRYARAAAVPTYVLFPDGGITWDGPISFDEIMRGESCYKK